MTGSTVLTVTAATLQSIAVTPANPSDREGRHAAVHGDRNYSDSSTQNLTSQVTWTSATTAVATITAPGLATRRGDGHVDITATLSGVTGPERRADGDGGDAAVDRGDAGQTRRSRREPRSSPRRERTATARRRT